NNGAYGISIQPMRRTRSAEPGAPPTVPGVKARPLGSMVVRSVTPVWLTNISLPPTKTALVTGSLASLVPYFVLRPPLMVYSWMSRYVVPSVQALAGGRYQVETMSKPVPSFLRTAMGVALGRAVAGRVSTQLVPAALVTPQSWPVTPAVRVMVAKLLSAVTVPPLARSRRKI